MLSNLAGVNAFPETPEEVRAHLMKLERRDWWIWCLSVLLIAVLTLAVVALVWPALQKELDPFLQFQFGQSLRGLVGLVVLFNIYTIYQLFVIKRLRRRLIEQQLRAEEFRQLAMFDPLTGVYNRRYAEERIGQEIARCQRMNAPLTVAVLDLDDFKEINDTYGHPAGDLALKEFADRLKRASRGSDLVARIGGDEFLLVLPECLPTQLQYIFNRMRPLRIDYQGKRIEYAFSVGHTTYQPGESPDQVLHNADQALYAHKRAPAHAD